MDLFMTKKELYSKVNDIRINLNIKEEQYPIDIEFESKLIPNLDMQYFNFKSNKLGGILMHGKFVDTMVLNQNRTKREREFDCAHELIHLFEHRTENKIVFNCTDKSYVRQLDKTDSTLEWQANEGAAELLLPWKHFIPDIINEYKTTECSFDNKSCVINHNIALKYGVTEAIILYRVENLKYEIIQYLDGKTLDNIDVLSNNQLKKYKINADNYLESLNEL